MKLSERISALWVKLRKELTRGSYLDRGESRLLIMWGILIVAVLVAAGVLMGIANGSQEGVKLLFPLVGTFLGAALAFAANVAQEQTKRKREAREALHRAVYVLIVQHNEISNYMATWQGYKALVQMAFNLPAFQPSEKFDFRQNIDSLTFLLRGDADDRNFLFKLTVEQQRFDVCLQAIRQRNEFYVNNVQKVMEQHFQQGDMVSEADLRKAFGTRIFEGAVNGMQNILQHISASDESLAAMHAACLKNGEKQFGPLVGLTKYEFPSPPEIPNWIKKAAAPRKLSDEPDAHAGPRRARSETTVDAAATPKGDCQ